jgi:phosphoglycerate dehydrogenase-like enzyme
MLPTRNHTTSIVIIDWLAKCTPNYYVRTLDELDQLTAVAGNLIMLLNSNEETSIIIMQAMIRLMVTKHVILNA